MIHVPNLWMEKVKKKEEVLFLISVRKGKRKKGREGNLGSQKAKESKNLKNENLSPTIKTNQ